MAVQVEKGATAAVFGLGTIGLACVDALATVGASRIIGVDTDPWEARARQGVGRHRCHQPQGLRQAHPGPEP